MSREDANLIIALFSLVVAVVATCTAVVAIRRDRADLRATGWDGAMGSAGVTIVNVGLRPVRVEQLLVHRWRLIRALGHVVPIDAWPAGDVDASLPVVIQPGGEAQLYYTLQDFMVFVGNERADLLVADAAGRRYRVGAGRLLERVPIELPDGMVRGPMPVPQDQDEAAPRSV